MLRVEVAERADWRATAARHGFAFHTIDGEPYWDERAYYRFTLRQIEDAIEAPTLEIHEMALDLVDDVLKSEALMTRLAIPEQYWDWIAKSWHEGAPHLYGRMDLAYDGRGPAKLYELNYDTPTAVYEAGFFQWIWLDECRARGTLPRDADQFNSIQELLIETFATIAPRINRPLYFAAMRDSVEDQGTIDYLRDCAQQAGLEGARIAIEDIGLTRDGRFTDLDDRVIGALFKLYPLEQLFTDEFGPSLPNSGLQLIEPPWKAVLSNKGILPLLYQRHPDHPNLLPAFFDDERSGALAPGWVRKPLLSREGANIELRYADGRSERSDGTYGDGPTIRQELHPLPQFAGRYPLIGSWVIADRAAGMGIREDEGPITRDTSRFVPHAIVD